MVERSGNAAIDQMITLGIEKQDMMRPKRWMTLVEKLFAVDWETRRDANSLLRGARARISNPINWTQGASARLPDGEEVTLGSPLATKWCAAGSMNLIGAPFAASTLLAMDALNVAAIRRGYAGIVPLNDAPDTVHQDVLATFDEATALLDAPTGGSDSN